MAPPPHQQHKETQPKAETAICGPEVEAVVTVDVTAARDLIATAGGHRYLDVRTEEELSRLGHLVEVDRSLNVPYMFITPQGSRVKNTQFVEQVASLFTSKEERIVLGCQSGKRSELACVDLLAAGFKNVKNMGGGYIAWLDHGFPVHHTNNNSATSHQDTADA